MKKRRLIEITAIILVALIWIVWLIMIIEHLGIVGKATAVANIGLYIEGHPEEELVIIEVPTGGGGGSIKKQIVWDLRKFEIYCNGLLITNETLRRLNFSWGADGRISLYGINWTIQKIGYCPWCYDGIKDYDEESVDCGGSGCKACVEAEVPEKMDEKTYILIYIIIIVLLAGIIYYLDRKGVIREVVRKIFFRHKYYGI